LFNSNQVFWFSVGVNGLSIILLHKHLIRQDANCMHNGKGAIVVVIVW